MKVLLFTHIFPSPAEPTRGPYNWNTFSPLARTCDVRLVSPEAWWTRIRRPAELLRPIPAQFGAIYCVYPSHWSVPKRPALHARSLFKSVFPLVQRIRAGFPFDVILATWAYPDSTAAAMMAKKLGCPIVIKVHGSDVNELTRYPALQPQIVEAFQTAAAIISVSEAMKTRIVELGIEPKKVVVIQNAVDGERFSIRNKETARGQLGIPVDERMVLSVGRLGSEKGLDVLLEAAKSLPDVAITLVGSGAEEQSLRKQATELGIAARVRFAGERMHDEIPLWIAACDLLALPSHREGCPNVVLEALASGRPVVASRVGGVPEIVNEHNGVMVPAGDHAALADAIKAVLSRQWPPDDLRSTVQSLSWDSVAEKVRNVLKNAVSINSATAVP